MVLDLSSKYGWIVPLKDKKGETVTEAFKAIFNEGRKPQYLWTDLRERLLQQIPEGTVEKRQHNTILKRE